MKHNANSTKEAAAKAKAEREAAPKVKKAEETTMKSKDEVDGHAETRDRLAGNLKELKATKGGPVSFLFLSGKDKEAIAAELKTAFKLGDAQAVKIVRRITGRVRLFQRVFELTGAIVATAGKVEKVPEITQPAMQESAAVLEQNMHNWVQDRIDNKERFVFGDFQEAMTEMGFERQAVSALKEPVKTLYKAALKAGS